MNAVYCATASGVDADSAAGEGGAVTGTDFFAAFLTVGLDFAGADFFGADFFTAAFLAGALFFTTFAGAFFTTAFLTAPFFVAAGFGLAVAAFFAAHRFFKAATIAALPALLSLRLGLGASSGVAGSDCFFAEAHRFRWASAIRARPAALILCLGFASVVGAFAGAEVPFERNPNWLRIAAILASIFCRSAS